MNDNEAMRELAENMWRYYFREKVREESSMSLQFYRAQVVTNNGNGTLSIQKPFDAVQTLPCVTSASALEAGDQCVVLVLGNAINSIVIGDGQLKNL